MDRTEIAVTLIIIALCALNLLTLWWAFKFRIPCDTKVRKIKAVISEFEANGYALIEFRRINPDNVFLRNPEGQ